MLKTTINLKERILFKLFSQIIKIVKPLDNFVFYKNKKINDQYNPIFIIGAPRTGSTVFYQYFVNRFDVAFISNFLSYFYHSIIIGAHLDKKLNTRNFLTLKSNYGITKGFHAPSECGQFWYRWFSKNKHYFDTSDLSPNDLKEIKKTILLMADIYSKHIVFKNLNNGQRIKIFKKIFPKALFIFIKRDPLYTAQSILKAREKYYNDKTQWFSVKPENYSDLFKLDYHEQIVKQIYFIEKQIKQDLDEMYPDLYISVEYEDFCKNPEKKMIEISDFLSQHSLFIKRKNIIQKANIFNNNKISLSLEDINEFKMNINKLDWINYSS